DLALDHRDGIRAPDPVLTLASPGLVGVGVQDGFGWDALEDRFLVALEAGGQQVHVSVVGVQGPGALLAVPVQVVAGEHLGGAVPGLPGVGRGPDLGGGDVAEAVVDHRPQVHGVVDGQDVAGQDGGDRV